MREFIDKIRGMNLVFIGLLVVLFFGANLMVNNVNMNPGQFEVQAQEEEAVKVIGAVAETRSLQETNSFNAVMQAGSEYAVMPKLEGELESVNVQVGDRVEQGQVLARIDAAMMAGICPSPPTSARTGMSAGRPGNSGQRLPSTRIWVGAVKLEKDFTGAA